MWRRRRQTSGEELIGECEAFLSGRFAERLGAHKGSVPVWAWTNLLAHGSERTLHVTSAMNRSLRSRQKNEWLRARAYLAHELLALARADDSLTDIQASVLVPLELELASRAEVAQWDHHRWVRVVEDALDDRRRVPRRSS